MGVYSIKPRFQAMLRGVEQALVARRVHPDHLTLGAVGLAAAGGVLLWASSVVPGLLLLVPPLVLGRTALNALDGMVARDRGLARPWGEVLNECGDRLADVLLFTGAALAPGSHGGLGAAVLVVMLLASYVGTATRAAGGRRQYGGIMGKADRMLALGGMAVLAFALPGVPVFTVCLGLVLAGLGATLITRLGAAYVDLQSVR